MITHYIKMAFRHIRQYKGQHLLSIFGVAVGLLCFSMTLYYLREYLLTYSAWPEYQRMAYIGTIKSDDNRLNRNFDGEKFLQLQNNPVAGIEAIAFFSRNWGKQNFTFEKENEDETALKCEICEINYDFFQVFIPEFILGSAKTLKEKEAFISETCARKIYGKENPIGKTLYLSRAITDTTAIKYYIISGVIKDLPDITYKKDIYFPISANEIKKSTNCQATALLSKEANIDEVNLRLRKQIVLPNQDEFIHIKLFTSPLENPMTIVGTSIISFIGALILIAGLINFLKFNITSFYTRSKELNLRTSFGATNKSLFSMLFIEIVILLIIATLVTFCLNEFFIPIFYTFLLVNSSELFAEIKISPEQLIWHQVEYLLGLLLLCAGIAWITVSRNNRKNIIRNIQNANINKHRFRNIMMGIQIAICLFFTGITFATYQAFSQMEEQRYYTLTPEETKEIYRIALNEPQLIGHGEEIISHIKNLKEVKDILFYHFSQDICYTPKKGNKIWGTKIIVGNNYADFMNLPVRTWGTFDENSILINHPLESILQQDSISGMITIEAPYNKEQPINTYQVNGAFELLPFTSLNKYNKISIISFQDNLSGFFYVKCHSGTSKKVKKQIENIVREYLPASIEFPIITMQEEFEQDFLFLKILKNIFLLLSSISLIITIIGVYSSIFLDTKSRQKEVAIRKINGASPKTIAFLFGKLYLYLLLIGSVFTFPLIYIIYTEILASEININAEFILNPLFWSYILLFTGSIIFLTVAWQIWKISRINPADVIKSE